MLRLCATVAVVGALAGLPALAQTTPPPLTPLPTPAINENAPPLAFIQAAQHALAAGRVGEAQEAIERAESRALTRSVRPSQARTADQQPLIQQLSQARQALAADDRMRAITLLEAAAASDQAK